ncbi:hypothetical protein BJX66DRAFT_344471 [Aspergillus keveii]|uniref:Uncharacterized protein n=1 Tax=Aspergillus keveii TaxID=714993 RepID=A0ABR4FL48_9EURO
MFRLTLTIATLWLIFHLVPALNISPPTSELIRLPRHLWDAECITKRDDGVGSIVLSDHEEFRWASTDTPHEKAVVVSMVAYSKQNEKILDMDRFAFALESASCNAEDMHIKFKHKLIYQAAKIAWQWVNYNDLRSFVLVPSWKGCGADKSHDPFVVSSVTFDDKTQRVNMVATQSTWKKVMNTFVLDFGEVVLGGDDNTKRDIIPDLDAKFRLDVGATLPQQIFKWQVNRGVLNASVTANCNECGTSGTLVFAGHVEASLGWDGVDIDKFEISVRPEGVQAHVGLSLDFIGHLDYTSFVRPSQEFEILEIPVSGWNIRGIFEFGPRILLNAGYSIDYIEGVASVGTGITARIPDTAIAKLDLLAEDSVEVSGWAPVIETDPLEAQAQINAQATLYTEIALSVSLTVLDDNGFGVDIALKVPEVTVTTSAGGNVNGFCENDPDPWGIMVEATVGAKLALEGWKELDGDKDELFGVDLFDKDDLYVFPQFCFSFGGLSEGFCLAEESPEDDDDEDDDDRLAGRAINGTDGHLLARQGPMGDRTISLDCDNKKEHAWPVLQYPQPATLREDGSIPIAKPNVPCEKSKENCDIEEADITLIWDDMTQRSVVEKDNRDWFTTTKQKRWDAEHIYEGNWVAKYITHVAKVAGWVNAAGEGCHEDVIALINAPPAADNPTPEGADAPDKVSKALMQQLATIATYEDRIAILQMTQNTMKFRMFNGDSLIAYFKDDKDNSTPEPVPNNHGRRSCDLARIVTTCKYMYNEHILARMNTTVLAIESVLRAMDEDVSIPRPEDKPDFSFVKEHRVFFEKTWVAGFEHAQKELYQYAEWLSRQPGAQAELGSDIWDDVTALAANDPDILWDFCPERPLDSWLTPLE